MKAERDIRWKLSPFALSSVLLFLLPTNMIGIVSNLRRLSSTIGEKMKGGKKIPRDDHHPSIPPILIWTDMTDKIWQKPWKYDSMKKTY